MKKITKIIALTIAGLLLALFSASASEWTGTLTTGLSTGVQGMVAALPPVASPGSGTYTAIQNVALTAAGSTSIRYTIDNSDPTCSTGVPYNMPIPVSQSLTIKALSCYPGNINSSVATFNYIINLPSPGSTPPPAAPGGGGGVPTSTPTPSPTPLSAGAQKVDANKDGKIDVLDFNILMINWGSTSANNPADFNSDGKVDIFDFNLLMINWS